MANTYITYIKNSDEYILKFGTNTFWNLSQISLEILDKLILKVEKNTFFNLRQIQVRVLDKYI